MPANGFNSADGAWNGMDVKTCRADASHKLVYLRPRSARYEGRKCGELCRWSEESECERFDCGVSRCGARVASCLVAVNGRLGL
jgi:hypothetical protein